MSLWIKICGNTSLEDARLAADAGADAIGFVFATSPRQVSADQVEAITSKLPQEIDKIGVFVETSFEKIRATVQRSRLTGVQLHSGKDVDLPKKLRGHFGPGLKILSVIHYAEGFSIQAATLARDTNTDALLLDSRTALAVGGTGIAFDWKSAAAGLSAGSLPPSRVVVAGGLNPDNVAEAIRILNPWGVDVVSGVEGTPGHKDPAKVRAFVLNARAAVASAVDRVG